MPEDKNYHMSPEEFRKYGRAVVDWIADYYEQIESLPVLSRVEPGEIRSMLPAQAPAHSEAFFDCDCFFVADRGALIQTLSILPEYLRNQATESGAVIDYRDWHVEQAWRKIQEVATEIESKKGDKNG